MKKVRKRWGAVEVALRPDDLRNYPCVVVDLFSIAAAHKHKEELFRSAAEAGLNAVFVLDAWHETHIPLARRYLELCRRYMLDCRLSERRPAEEHAVELACAMKCAVATRDFDAVRRAQELSCDVPILVLSGGMWYRVSYGRAEAPQEDVGRPAPASSGGGPDEAAGV